MKMFISSRAKSPRTFTRMCWLASAVAALAVTARSASAVIITYTPPPLVGTEVTYPSVSESNSGTTAMYGTPAVSGDNLVFGNMNFSTSSINGSPPLTFVDGQINAIIQAKPGFTLSSFKLTENGDYNVSAGALTPTAIGYVKVFPQAVQITVLAENGVPLATPLVNNTSVIMSLSPSGGDFQTGIDPSTGSWAGSATANLAALFGSNNITSVSIAFDNQLEAESQVGAIATISKKGFTIDPTTAAAVPEPTTLGLLVAGIALGTTRRRRSLR